MLLLKLNNRSSTEEIPSPPSFFTEPQRLLEDNSAVPIKSYPLT